MDVSIFSDPAIIGPGCWFKIHTDARTAVTDDLKQSFEININELCDNFKCKKCQGHFRKFIDTHPLKNYWNIYDEKGRDIGFFQWSWELHNQVNRWLKKYEPTLEEAYEFYASADAGACFDCGAGGPDESEETGEQRSRAIPSILTLFRETGSIKPKPFRMISH